MILMPKSMGLSKFSRFIKDGVIHKILIIAIIIGVVWSQTNFVITDKYIYSNSDVPASLTGYKIVHIADISNKMPAMLIPSVKSEKPDLIILSGGYSDGAGASNTTKNIINSLTNIAPVYYVYSSRDSMNELQDTSAINIEGTCQIVEGKNKSIDDTKDSFGSSLEIDINKQVSENTLNSFRVTGNIGADAVTAADANLKLTSVIGTDPSQLSILVLGDNEYTQIMSYTDADMILTGGTYGKTPVQIDGVNRITVECKNGMMTEHGTSVFVTSGVGSVTGSRIFNYPRIQSITLSDGSLTRVTPLEKLLGKFIK